MPQKREVFTITTHNICQLIVSSRSLPIVRMANWKVLQTCFGVLSSRTPRMQKNLPEMSQLPALESWPPPILRDICHNFMYGNISCFHVYDASLTDLDTCFRLASRIQTPILERLWFRLFAIRSWKRHKHSMMCSRRSLSTFYRLWLTIILYVVFYIFPFARF